MDAVVLYKVTAEQGKFYMTSCRSDFAGITCPADQDTVFSNIMLKGLSINIFYCDFKCTCLQRGWATNSSNISYDPPP